MDGKKIVLSFGFAYLAVIFLFCGAFFAGAPKLLTETEEASTEANPSLSAQASVNLYRDHYFLKAFRRGDCKKLRGKILITFFLLDDEKSTWTQDAVEELKRTHQKSTEKLLRDAAWYGVFPEVELRYLTCSLEGVLRDRNSCLEDLLSALAGAGFPDPYAVIPSFQREFGVDEAPIAFCLNRSDRSFARQERGEGYEFAVLFGKDEDYRHELYHLFGAMDLYQNDEVAKAAVRYFPNSIMQYSGEDLRVDELTAYLMGWTDYPYKRAVRFLEETKHLTAEDFAA